MSARDVVVLGAGAAGLACGHRLAAAGLDVLVLERAASAGGNVRTVEVDGYRLERGPHTLLASADTVFELALEAGLEADLVATRPEAAARFVARDGRLHPIPTGPLSFLGSRLLSTRSKLELATEPFRLRRGEPGDTAAAFFDRRFGPEAARVLAGAFVSGVYAGDPALLSAPAAFPLFWAFEQEAGSMIRGALRHGRRRRQERRAKGLPRRRGLFSFAEGLGQLTDALGERLGERLVLGVEALAVRRDARDLVVETSRGDVRARQLVCALPPAEAAALFAGLDPELAELLGGVPMAPVAVVALGYARRQPAVPDGFGFLVPRGEGIRTLGVLFPSRLFEGRAPEGGDLLMGYVGGMTDPAALDLDDGALAAVVLDDLRSLTCLDASPDLLVVRRHPAAIPQLVLGHLDRMAAARDRLAAIPGLHLAGNYLRGVGLKDAVATGLEAAARIAEAA